MSDLQSALNHLLAAKRISAQSQSYKKDNPVEYAKVYKYLIGGPRPDGVATEMGKGLVEVEDVRRASVEPPLETELWHRYTYADWPDWEGGSLSWGADSADLARPSGSPTANWVKIFLKDGSYDGGGAERSEMSNGWTGEASHFREGDHVQFRWWHAIGALPTYSGDWNIVTQNHFSGDAGDSQPNLIFAYEVNRKLEFKTSTGGGHVLHWTSPNPIPLNTPVKIELRVLFSKSDVDGVIELKIDDSLVVPAKPCATWWSGGTPSTIAYLKQGLYRNQAVAGDATIYHNGLQCWWVT